MTGFIRPAFVFQGKPCTVKQNHIQQFRCFIQLHIQKESGKYHIRRQAGVCCQKFCHVFTSLPPVILRENTSLHLLPLQILPAPERMPCFGAPFVPSLLSDRRGRGEVPVSGSFPLPLRSGLQNVLPVPLFPDKGLPVCGNNGQNNRPERGQLHGCRI